LCIINKLKKNDAKEIFKIIGTSIVQKQLDLLINSIIAYCSYYTDTDSISISKVV